MHVFSLVETSVLALIFPLFIFRFQQYHTECPSPEKTDQYRRQFRFQEFKRRQINGLHNKVMRRLRSTNSRKGTPGVNVNRMGC
jgi:hypothetical protein